MTAAGDLTDLTALNTLAVGTAGPRIAFLHGLFGQGRNWNQIAKGVSGPDGTDARCLLIDLPDHGRSPWSEAFSLAGYADAVAETLDTVGGGEPWVVVGHSLGGKTAMVLALRHPALVDRLVVVDIAPKGYGSLERFEGYIREMQALPLGEVGSRADAESRFVEPDPGVKAFLLQNLRRDGAGLALAGQPRPRGARRRPRLAVANRRAGRMPSTPSRPTPARCCGSPVASRRTSREMTPSGCGATFPAPGSSRSRAPGTGCTPTPPTSSSRPCAASSRP